MTALLNIKQLLNNSHNENLRKNRKIIFSIFSICGELKKEKPKPLRGKGNNRSINYKYKYVNTLITQIQTQHPYHGLRV
jgi:hypothetical protein